MAVAPHTGGASVRGTKYQGLCAREVRIGQCRAICSVMLTLYWRPQLTRVGQCRIPLCQVLPREGAAAGLANGGTAGAHDSRRSSCSSAFLQSRPRPTKYEYVSWDGTTKRRSEQLSTPKRSPTFNNIPNPAAGHPGKHDGHVLPSSEHRLSLAPLRNHASLVRVGARARGR